MCLCDTNSIGTSTFTYYTKSHTNMKLTSHNHTATKHFQLKFNTISIIGTILCFILRIKKQRNMEFLNPQNPCSLPLFMRQLSSPTQYNLHKPPRAQLPHTPPLSLSISIKLNQTPQLTPFLTVWFGKKAH